MGEEGPEDPAEAGWRDAGDPFLTHATGRVDRPISSRKTKRWGWVVDALQASCLVTVPWMVFSILSLLFTLAYHHWHLEVWVCVLAGVVISMMIIGAGATKAGGAASQDRDAFYFFLGTLCLVATTFAAGLGYYNYHSNMFAYWSLRANGEYINLMPSQFAEAHSDAGKIVFTEDTRVDTSRAVGYKDGITYCVAPILDDVPVGKIQYWAAGTDCCMGRADFNCDDAWNPKARSGVVILDSNTWMPSNRDKYTEAVKVAEATYEIVSAKEPLFVRWVADPEIIQDDFWRNGVGFLVAEISIYLLCSIIFGGMGITAVKRAALF